MSFLDPSAGVQIQQPYQLDPWHTQGADTGAYKGAQSLGQYNLGGQNLGQFQSLTQQGVNNPWAGMYQQGAGVAGGLGMQGGLQGFGAGSALIGAGQGLLPDVQQLLAMGFDPQQALYQRTQQQVADQNAARMAQSGLASTPYGQGVQNQANSNFNIDWQNQQLQRAMMGAQGASGLLGAAGGAIRGGTAEQDAALNQYMQGAGLPYNTYNQIIGNQLGLLSGANQYGQEAAKIPQMQIQDYLSYLNQANQNAQTRNQTAGLQLQQAKDSFNEMNTLGTEAGQMMMGMPPGMGGGGGMGGYGGGGGYGYGGGGFGFGPGQGFGGGGFSSIFGPWGGGGGGYSSIFG